MATITPKILKANQKQDGTWNVVYRLSHNRKTRYIKTHHYVTSDHVVNGDDVHIDFVIDHLATDLKQYRKRISEIENIELMSVDDIKELITNDSKDIGFKQFVIHHIEKLKKEGREKTAKPFITVFNSLNDYSEGEIYASQITSKFLEKYEIYLRTPKKIKRQQGSVIAEKETKLNDKGLNNHMSAFRTLFNAARNHYNDEDIGKIIIKNNPFSKYKIAPKKRKEHKNLDVTIIRTIRDYKPESRIEKIGHHMFMFSFYMCGMNTVDIYKNWNTLKGKPDRIGYNRSKTEGKREDSAYISVNIPMEAAELIDMIKITHNTIDLLNKEISLGLISIRKKLGIDKLTMLYARHSFATIARNDLNIPKDDVALALNHVNQNSRITDTYLAPDWSKVDNVQKKVIDYINEDLKH